jgi:hypothetical protein
MATVIWTGTIDQQTYRVVDLGAAAIVPRLQVEMQQSPDLMGAQGWGRFDPIPTAVFSAMLLAAGVVT